MVRPDDDRLRAEAEIIKLLGLLQEHFFLEESMMQKLHHPDLEQHIEEHRQFHSDAHHLAQTSLMKKEGVPREALKLAHTWLLVSRSGNILRKSAGFLKCNLSNKIILTKYLIKQCPNVVHIFVANLNKHTSARMKQVTRHNQAVA